MRILKGALAFHPKRCSDCSARRVSIALRDVLFEPDAEWHGRSFGSSVAYQSSKLSNVRTRPSKGERGAMVESFVCKYRANNGGKFPTITLTKKAVGGSFYIVRGILQKLKFESKTTSLSVRKVLPVEVAAAENNASFPAKNEAEADCDARYKHVGADSQSQMSACVARGFSAVVVEHVSSACNPDPVKTETNQRRHPIHHISNPSSNEIKDASNPLGEIPVIIAADDQLHKRETETIPQNYVESKQDSASSLPKNQTNVVSDAFSEKPDLVEEPSVSENLKSYGGQEVKEEASSVTRLVFENPKGKNEKVISESLMCLDDQEPRADHYQGSADLGNAVPLEVEKRDREVSDQESGELQTAKRASLWSNVKSLAGGILNFWRKG